MTEVQLTLTRLEATLSVRDEMKKSKDEETERRLNDLETEKGEPR